MRTVILEARSDDYDSAPGLAVAGTRDFEGFMADRGGLLIAHDLLEHQNGIHHIGPVWDELEALGAVHQVRGRHGDMLQDHPSYHSVAVNLASDLTRMFQEYASNPDTGPGGLAVGSRPHDYDDDFREAIELARRDIPSECNDMGRGEPDEDENGWSPELHALFEEYLTLALHRMRAGFRKAQKRFGDGYYGSGLFVAIRDAVKGAARDCEYEGQRFRLTYGNREAHCVELYEAED